MDEDNEPDADDEEDESEDDEEEDALVVICPTLVLEAASLSLTRCTSAAANDWDGM